MVRDCVGSFNTSAAMMPSVHRRLNRVQAFAVTCALTCAVAASVSCKSATNPGATVQASVQTVLVTPLAVTVDAGASSALTATVYSTTGGILTNRAVTWSSDNPGIATVTSAGVVTGVAGGATSIRATVDNKSGVALVTVSQAAVATVQITPAALSVAVGTTGTLTATMRSAAGAVLTGRAVIWTSTATSVATVSQSGVVTGVTVGTAIIVAASEGKQQSITVTVTPAPQATFASIAPGGTHSCALDNAGKAFCWGSSQFGQVGNTAIAGIALTPVQVTSALTFASIASGMYHSCALTAAGVAYCWGWNLKGQLGDGTNTDRNTPSVTNTALRFFTIAAGGQPGGEHTCALTVAGVAYCWGWNAFGQLGDGTTLDRTTPVQVLGGLTFTSISVGNLHSCALTATGKAYCWGSAAEIGEGLGANRTAPVAVSGDLAFKTLSASWWSACGVASDDKTNCWGSYLTNATGPATPTPVFNGFTFASVASSYGGGCGLTTAGAGFCWGINNAGQIGDGTTTQRATPVAVSGSIVFARIVAGYGHTCGLTAAGLAYCWGGNESGQVGDGSQINKLVPTAVRGGQ